MNTIRKHLLSVLAVAILGFGLSVAMPGVRTNASPADKDVLVINSPSEAVPVLDVKSSTRQPFQAMVDIEMPQDTAGENALLPVPSGKRLVIEFATGRGSAPAGQAMAFSIRSTLGGTLARHWLAAEQQSFGPGSSQFLASQATRIYTDPGADVLLRIDRSFGVTGLARGQISVSGYLEDAP
jgi:hypothetical protein